MSPETSPTALSGVNLASGTYSIVNGANAVVATGTFTAVSNGSYTFGVGLVRGDAADLHDHGQGQRPGRQHRKRDHHVRHPVTRPVTVLHQGEGALLPPRFFSEPAFAWIRSAAKPFGIASFSLRPRGAGGPGRS